MATGELFEATLSTCRVYAFKIDITLQLHTHILVCTSSSCVLPLLRNLPRLTGLRVSPQVDELRREMDELEELLNRLEASGGSDSVAELEEELGAMRATLELRRAEGASRLGERRAACREAELARQDALAQYKHAQKELPAEVQMLRDEVARCAPSRLRT